MLPEALENISVHSQYKADDEKMHELERDVAKYWKEKYSLQSVGLKIRVGLRKTCRFAL